MVGEAPKDDGIVEPGMVVVISMAGKERTFLLGNREIADGDDSLEVYSSESPLGSSIHGSKVGDSVDYTEQCVVVRSSFSYVLLVQKPMATSLRCSAASSRRPPRCTRSAYTLTAGATGTPPLRSASANRCGSASLGVMRTADHELL